MKGLVRGSSETTVLPAARTAGSVAVRILSLAVFASRANLRGGLTVGGILLGIVVMLVGPLVAVSRDLAWSYDRQFGFFGFAVLALFTVRSGYQEQRELGLAVYFRQNVGSSLEHALAMVISVIAAWAAVCVLGFLAFLAISGGDMDLSAWYTASWGLRTLLLVGFVPLVEHAAAFRLPFLVPALAYLVLLIALSILLPEAEALALFVPTPTGDTAALAHLARQVTVVLPTATAAFVLLVLVDPWLRRRLDRGRWRR